MFHRPLTNTSSLKITAAYCVKQDQMHGFEKIHVCNFMEYKKFKWEGFKANKVTFFLS